MLNHDGLWVYTEAKLLTSNKPILWAANVSKLIQDDELGDDIDV